MNIIRKYENDVSAGRVRLDQKTDNRIIEIDSDTKVFSDIGNVEIEFKIQTHALLDIVVFIEDCKSSKIFLKFNLAKYSQLRCVILSDSCRNSNITVEVFLNGEGANSNVRSFFCGRNFDKQILAISHIHYVCNTTSNALSKTILDDFAISEFYGNVDILEGAENSDASQLNHNILFSEHAKVSSCPNLNILNNNVKCSHGATVGAIDEGTLFYMMSRGIDFQTCKHLIEDGIVISILKQV